MIVSEIHPATVVANKDPEKRGRIKVACSALMGSEDVTLPDWVDPVFEWGWFVVPDVGEVVDLESASGSDDDEQRGQISISNPNWRWRGRYWGGQATEVKRPVPEDFTTTNYGKRRGFATPAGHVLMFDDTEGKEKVSLTFKGKAGVAYMAFDEDGSWICSNAKGSLLYLNAKAGEMSWIDQHGNTIASASTGIKIIDKNGNSIETKDGVINVLGQGAVNVKCKDAVIDAGAIELAQPAADKVILGDTFMNTVYKTHTHPTGTGPSGPPVPQPSEAQALSTKVKVG